MIIWAKIIIINSFFKRKKDNNLENNILLGFNVKTLTSNKRSSKFLVIKPEEHPLGSSMVELEEINFKAQMI